MTGMKARERQEGAGAGQDLDQDQGLEAAGGGPDLGVSPGHEEDLDPRRGLDPTPGILMKSQKVAQGAGRDLEVDPRAETRKEVAQSQVQDPGLGPVIKSSLCTRAVAACTSELCAQPAFAEYELRGAGQS